MKRKYGSQRTNLTLCPLAQKVYDETDPLNIYEEESGLYTMTGVLEYDHLTERQVNEILIEYGPSVVDVTFSAGRGQDYAEVNYMLGELDDVLLYAEEPIPSWVRPGTTDMNKFDEESYPRLKAEILRQAKENGIDAKRLHFFWD